MQWAAFRAKSLHMPCGCLNDGQCLALMSCRVLQLSATLHVSLAHRAQGSDGAHPWHQCDIALLQGMQHCSPSMAVQQQLGAPGGVMCLPACRRGWAAAAQGSGIVQACLLCSRVAPAKLEMMSTRHLCMVCGKLAHATARSEPLREHPTTLARRAAHGGG